MAQFDVYQNRNPDSNQAIPFLLDVQADLLSHLATRVVVPLVSAVIMDRAINYLNPQFVIANTPVVMSTAEMAGVSVHVLGEKIFSLNDRRDEIIAALDFLIMGF